MRDRPTGRTQDFESWYHGSSPCPSVGYYGGEEENNINREGDRTPKGYPGLKR